MHSIEVGITVQGEDLNQLRFSCILEFTSFSSSSLLLLLSSGNSIGFNSSSLYSGSPTWPNKKSSLLILEPPLSKLPSALIWRKGFYVHQRWSSKSQYVLSVSYLQEWYHHYLCDFKIWWLWSLYFGHVWFMPFCFIKKNHFRQTLLLWPQFPFWLWSTVKPVYKMTTLGTTQKWSPWASGCLIKQLYKITTNQMWSFLAGF